MQKYGFFKFSLSAQVTPQNINFLNVYFID